MKLWSHYNPKVVGGYTSWGSKSFFSFALS